MAKVFGKKPWGKRLDRISKSSNYKDGVFQNIEPTSVMNKDANFFMIMRDFYSKPKDVTPLQVVPHIKTDLKSLALETPVIVWFGHSSYMIQSKGFTVVVDPVLSGNASPVKFFGKEFKGTSVYTTDDFPEIDLLVITHDHYDHLDYKTIVKFKDKIKQVVCSMGVGSHLEYWGIAPAKITELNWWENYKVNEGIELTATPARHFTGRLFKRGKTLWSSFVLKLHGRNLFLGGDSGYDAQFKKIGETFGPFDLAFLECGQYGKNWVNIHMFPEETVQAAKDLGAAILFPVHWSKFALSNHSWNESIKRLAVEAKKQNQDYVMPLIGQSYVLGETFEQKEWWLGNSD